MSSYNEQVANSSRANTDAVLQISTVLTEASKRLLELQTEAAREAFAENSKALKSLFNATDSTTALAEWPRFFQGNGRRMSELTRRWFEIVAEAQTRISQLMTQSFSVYNQEMQHDLERFAKATNEMRDAASSEVKDFVAKAGDDISGAVRKPKVA